MIIDAHVHILDRGNWPGAWWDYVANSWASSKAGRKPSQIRDRIEDGLIDPGGSRMVADMDTAGVDVAVNLVIDWGPDYPAPCSIQESVRDALGCTSRHPQRIVTFAGIDPRREHAADQLERWITEDGVSGLKLYPSCGWWPQDAGAMALYDVCNRHDVPVLFHTGSPLALLEAEYSDASHLRPVVEAFPDLKLWIGHAGQRTGWNDALEVVEASNAASLEMSGWLWTKSTEDDEIDLARRIIEARDRVGATRILFGTDHVSGTKERPAGFMTQIADMFSRLPQTAESIGLEISEREMTMIMGANAARDLRVSAGTDTSHAATRADP